jgi:SPP1 gp7 family putative phage head morphogenesis protein
VPISKPNIIPIADRLKGQVRRNFLAAMTKLRNEASAAEIVRAIEGGDLSVAQSVISQSKLAKHLEPVIGTMNAAIVAAGKVTIENIGVQIRFDIKNPFAIDAAIEHRARLVRNVTKATQQGIAKLVSRGIVDGIPPRDLAKMIKPMIGLTNNQASAALHLRKTLLKSGVTAKNTSTIVGKFIDKQLRYRAETIAITETVRASNMGQHAAWNDAIDRRLIRVGGEPREWLAADSERTCPVCNALDGEIVEFSQPFSQGMLYPPAHPRCRCSVGLVYEKV